MSTDNGRLKREAAKRRKPNQTISVAKADLQSHLEDGWEIEKELTRVYNLKKPWSHDKLLENKVWLLHFLLGYSEINAGHNFQVRIERKGAKPLYKQVDVLAKDDETVIVAECKSSARITKKRSLQKDIEEFANLKGPISSAIKKHYGSEFRPKIIWMFFTHNIGWSDPDKERAAGENINIVTERELRYYLQIADHLKAAARFQYLAEFLRDQKIPEMEGVKVPCVRGKLGGRKFYSFVSTPKQMLKIAFVNHRSLNDPSGAPSYQRLVSRTRLRQIGKFITDGGFFPTNILVNFVRKCTFEQKATDAETNVAFGDLILPNRYRSAWVIDGQHRLYGYAPLKEDFLSQNVMVVAFEGLKKEEEANLFVTINHEQKSVPKTLLDDLEGELKWGSDKPSERIGSIAARLIGRLNNDIGEPLYGRVTQQGITPTEKTCLTVPALKDGIRRSGLIGEAILKNKEYSPGPLSSTDDFITLERARDTLNSYFQILSTANPSEWEIGRKGHVCTNVSLQAHLKLLGSLIVYMEANKGMNARELNPNEIIAEIEEYIDPIIEFLNKSNSQQIEKRFKVQFGSGGPKEYYYRLCSMIREHFSDFSPEGIEEWIEGQSEDRVRDADQKLKEINIKVQKQIFDTFKELYGEENSAYFDKGITDKKIKGSAFNKSLENDLEDRLPLENYLDFIEYKKIVEQKQNWPSFKNVFDIPEPGEKGYTKNIQWMERINEIRRIPAHPTEKRQYKTKDLEYIDFVYAELTERLGGNMTKVE